MPALIYLILEFFFTKELLISATKDSAYFPAQSRAFQFVISLM